MYIDQDGKDSASIYSFAQSLALADGPLPICDAVGLIIIVGDYLLNKNNARNTVYSYMYEQSHDSFLVLEYSEHKKRGSVHESNREEHEKAEARRSRDKRGEKGDKRRKQDRSNKRKTSIAGIGSGGEAKDDKIVHHGGAGKPTIVCNVYLIK